MRYCYDKVSRNGGYCAGLPVHPRAGVLSHGLGGHAAAALAVPPAFRRQGRADEEA